MDIGIVDGHDPEKIAQAIWDGNPSDAASIVSSISLKLQDATLRHDFGSAHAAKIMMDNLGHVVQKHLSAGERPSQRLVKEVLRALRRHLHVPS